MAGDDREYTVALKYDTRLRVGHTIVRGTPVEFVVQLEYHLDGEWRIVARFDHNPDLRMGHDVTDEGLHLDIYRNGAKHYVERDFPAVNIYDAIAYCETYLERNAVELIGRFERWNDTHPRTDEP